MAITRAEPREALRADLVWGVGAAVLACVAGALALHLWNADLRVPFSDRADALHNQLIIKTVLDHGWYQHNPDLGAPFGLKLYDFPVVSGDNLQILLMKAIGIFTKDSALVLNLYFLLTFPLAAATAFACSRLLGLSRPASLVVAVLFAILPYHFLHGEGHLFIAGYYAVPISCLLVVRALGGDAFDLRDRRTLLWLAAAAIVVGSAHVYYAVFAIALMTAAIVVRLIVDRPRGAAAAATVVAAIAAITVANHLPNIVYRAQHGQNSSPRRLARRRAQRALDARRARRGAGGGFPRPDELRIGARLRVGQADLRERRRVRLRHRAEARPRRVGLRAAVRAVPGAAACLAAGD